MDQRIEVYGTTRHDLNGMRGAATDVHPSYNANEHVVLSQSRYSIHLDSGEVFKVKFGNLRAVDAERECADNAEEVLADLD